MKVWVLSDIHVDVAPMEGAMDVPDADVCVFAGDLCSGVTRGMHYMADLIDGRMPCIFVAGNHEYWNSSITDEIRAGREAADRLRDVYFLQNEAVDIDGVRFIGATLWTDFAVGGHRRLAMTEARERMRDYKRISFTKRPWVRFTPEVSARLHAESLSFLEMNVGITGKSVIVTHHAPHPDSLENGCCKTLIDASYASDLEPLMRLLEPTLWVHGHTHVKRDYMVGGTRVVSNPRGYAHERIPFDRSMIITV